ncbi:hypothetical protein HK100_004826 [Physocladia obscura]|uniref:F-box domain-containing protein n=1 Tax=Physocladia obscura TaxID=109957 RepID=A0AAD5STX1_9FUNG|nr:hypothetical protein HK100_004826 [Physocladia obscura]
MSFSSNRKINNNSSCSNDKINSNNGKFLQKIAKFLPERVACLTNSKLKPLRFSASAIQLNSPRIPLKKQRSWIFIRPLSEAGRLSSSKENNPLNTQLPREDSPESLENLEERSESPMHEKINSFQSSSFSGSTLEASEINAHEKITKIQFEMKLPNELIALVFSLIPPESVTKYSRLSKSFKSIVTESASFPKRNFDYFIPAENPNPNQPDGNHYPHRKSVEDQLRDFDDIYAHYDHFWFMWPNNFQIEYAKRKLIKQPELSVTNNQFREYSAWMRKVPNCTSMLDNLREISLCDLNMHGEFSTVLCAMPKLELIYAPFNSFSGPIPQRISNMKNLAVLNMGNNKISGPFPTVFGDFLTNLKSINFERNQLIGPLPHNIGALVNLRALTLALNNLCGRIPNEICCLVNLTTLDLSRNKFEGPIPAGIGSLVHINMLDISNNKLSGNIPAGLGSCSALNHLTMSRNRLNGRLPETICNLINLYALYFDNNNIEGLIPANVHNMYRLAYVAFHGNNLQVPENVNMNIRQWKLFQEGFELSARNY